MSEQLYKANQSKLSGVYEALLLSVLLACYGGGAPGHSAQEGSSLHPKGQRVEMIVNNLFLYISSLLFPLV